MVGVGRRGGSALVRLLIPQRPSLNELDTDTGASEVRILTSLATLVYGDSE